MGSDRDRWRFCGGLGRTEGTLGFLREHAPDLAERAAK